MKHRHLTPLLLPLLALLAMGNRVHGEATEWQSVTLNDIGYLPLENLRSFYKLTPVAPPRNDRTGSHTIGNADVNIRFTPGERDMQLGGYHCQLAHPVRQDEKGELLISRMDIVKLIDPLLRPTYISHRRKIRTIVIDPGHGGHDAGATASGVREADCTLLVAQRLRDILRQRGYDVILTREQNQYLSDQQRIDRANAAPDALFLSLHLNSGRSDIRGIETYAMYPAGKGEPALPGNIHDSSNAALAFALQASLISRTGAQDGGFRRARYSLLSSVNCPAALVELGYITHSEEVNLLGTDTYQTQLAQALADGIDTFANVANPATALQSKPDTATSDTPPRPYKADPPPPAKNREEADKTSAKKKPASNRRSNNNARRKNSNIRSKNTPARRTNRSSRQRQQNTRTRRNRT